MSAPELTIIVPNYNDGESCSVFLREIVEAMAARPDYSFEVLIVDDGSRDGSVDLLRAAIAAMPGIRLIELFRNFGQQAALHVGLTQARGTIVVTIDGDGQYPASTIPQLADAIRAGAEVASGIRTIRLDTVKDRLSSKLGGYFIRQLLGFDIQDFGAVKAFSRGIVDRVVAAPLGYADVYPAALSWRPKLAEIPIPHRARALGESKWSLTKRVKLYFDLYFKYAEDRFGLIFKAGVFLMLNAVLWTAIGLFYKLLLGHQDSVFLFLAVGAIFFVLGMQFVLWSFTASALKQVLRGGAFSPADMIRSRDNRA